MRQITRRERQRILSGLTSTYMERAEALEAERTKFKFWLYGFPSNFGLVP
jgi:hypothetical protein